MISIIITTFKETRTIRRCLDAILSDKLPKDYEILVVSPDLDTKEAIADYLKKYKKVKHLQDEGKGKPAALNLAFKKAKGSVLVLTDGDVHVAPFAIQELVKPFKEENVGLVSSRPLSLERRDTMLGFWSHLLTDIAHRVRLKSEFIVGSGYLMAVKAGMVDHVPKDALSDDAVISHFVFDKGFKTVYAPNAKVFVKFPDSFADWIKQKKRSTGGYIQLKKYVQKKERMRSFSKESAGIFMLFTYCRNFKQAFWTLVLVFARIYLWFLIFLDLKLKRKSFKQIWVRVESTK